jgi:hypothetical protein
LGIIDEPATELEGIGKQEQGIVNVFLLGAQHEDE